MTLLSRSGTTDPAGKLTRRIDVPISEKLEEALIGMAFVLQISKAEVARHLLEEAMFGRAVMVQSMAQARQLRPSDEYPHADNRGCAA